MKLQTPIRIKRQTYWNEDDCQKTRRTFTLRSPVIIHNPLALASTLRELNKEIKLRETEYRELEYTLTETKRQLTYTEHARDSNDKNYRRVLNERHEEDKKNEAEREEKDNAINYIENTPDWQLGIHYGPNGRDRFEFLSFKPRLIDSRIETSSAWTGRRDKLASPETVARVCEHIDLKDWRYEPESGYFTLKGGGLAIYDWVRVKNTILNTEAKLQQFLDEMIHAQQVADALAHEKDTEGEAEK